MKTVLIILFLLTSKIIIGQVQWFPAKYDSINKKYVADSSGAFPVSFISIQHNKAFMYGQHTNYQTVMKFTNKAYFSNYLTIPITDSLSRVYAKATYYFRINKNMADLIIQLNNKTDTIKFIKSTKPLKNINARWG